MNWTEIKTALTPDEETVYCGGCGAVNQGNPCGACRARPGGGFVG